ncbi:MAG: hypothetical protein ACKV1O_02440 [Saprospiraceae bacterium]
MRKVTIVAFSDEATVNSEIGRFTLPINPENISRNHQINLEDTQAPGNQANNANHAASRPEELRLEFTLDNTNTVEGNLLEGTPVGKQVEDFLKLTYKLNGDIRKPNFLKIIWWDDFVFDCQLSNAQVNYTLFLADGTPLRAKISATFRQHVAPNVRVAIEDKATGALTKTQSAAETGARITSVAQKAYADPNSYLQLAKANDLVNFRKALQDTQLVLPAVASAAEEAKKTAEQVRNTASAAQNTANRIGNLF